MASAALKRYEDQGRPEEDLPFLQWSVQDALARTEDAFYGFFMNLPLRPIAWAMRLVIFPYGREFEPPRDRLGHQVVALLLQPGPARERLTAGVHIPKDPKEPVEEPYTRLEIEVNLQGKFASAQRFVDQLMRFPKIVAVQQMSIHPKPAGEKDEPGLLEIQLKVTAFIMKGEQPVLPSQPAVSASNTLPGKVSAGGIN